MTYKNVLNQIKVLLGMEVKLSQMKLDDGITVVEAEEFAPDYSIGIVTDAGITPLPVGDYTLEDGTKLTVAQEGIIATVTPANAAAEQPTPEAVAAPDMKAEPAAPKRVVESVSKETFFSEQLAEKDAEIERLKTELAKHEQPTEEPKPVELAADPEPIVHNPENEKRKSLAIKGTASIENNVKQWLYN